MPTKTLAGIIFLLLLTSCSSEPTCSHQAFTTCSHGTYTYYAELSIVFPEIERKSDGKACKVEYPRPFPLATNLLCKQSVDGKDTSSSVAAKYEDLDGVRIYSCVESDGNVLVHYIHDSDFARFKETDKNVEVKCSTSTTVDDH